MFRIERQVPGVRFAADTEVLGIQHEDGQLFREAKPCENARSQPRIRGALYPAPGGHLAHAPTFAESPECGPVEKIAMKPAAVLAALLARPRGLAASPAVDPVVTIPVGLQAAAGGATNLLFLGACISTR